MNRHEPGSQFQRRSGDAGRLRREFESRRGSAILIMRTALAITHVAFEDWGSLATELVNAGFKTELIDALDQLS